ncbi:hypothetical protein BDR06DRAFT_996647 [Suillus hirtellus]|nr:hypothetical protein BDR06DRAFT_996647 [Suillus hirtellus]
MTSTNQSRNSSSVPLDTTAIIRGSSARPPHKFCRFLKKVKYGVTKNISCSNLRNLRGREPVLPNVDHTNTLSTADIEPEVQDAPSGVKQDADPRSALRDAKEAVKRMNLLSGPVKSGASAAQNASGDLEDAYSFQDTYLQFLRIFDNSIGKLAEISQQTLECARFIRDYSETKNFWKRLWKDILTETNHEIKCYSDALDALMQSFRDRVARDLSIILVPDATAIHFSSGELLDLSGITYAGLDTRKQCLPGTRTEVFSQITNWVNSTEDDAPRVLWLSGTAGKGKSAIAHTIAKWFSDAGGLGRQMTCFTDLNHALNTAHRLKAGTAWISCVNPPNSNVPFDGFKQSGIGRECGDYALTNYTAVKAAHVNLGHKVFAGGNEI